MTEKNAIIHVDFDGLRDPAMLLIEKVSNGISGLAEPWQIVRLAKAEVEAGKIETLGKIEISEIERRAANRLLAEETRKQANIEAITQKALPLVGEDAQPQGMDDDWIVNFFDKCRLVGDEQMQSLWARILAGEANKPGMFSRRTVNFMSSMDKSDASLFTQLCGFCWDIGNGPCSIVFDSSHNIYASHGIAFGSLKHLDDIGFISFDNLSEYALEALPKHRFVGYFGEQVDLQFKKPAGNRLLMGHVKLSQIGEELAPIAGGEPVEGFVDYVTEYWQKKGVTVS